MAAAALTVSTLPRACNGVRWPRRLARQARAWQRADACAHRLWRTGTAAARARVCNWSSQLSSSSYQTAPGRRLTPGWLEPACSTMRRLAWRRWRHQWRRVWARPTIRNRAVLRPGLCVVMHLVAARRAAMRACVMATPTASNLQDDAPRPPASSRWAAKRAPGSSCEPQRWASTWARTTRNRGLIG